MDFQKLLEKYNINGNVCVTINGENVFSGAHGLVDRERKIPYSVNSRTYVASVTKQFTAACAMMLVEENRLDIDKKLIEYLPEYSKADKMTLRQMLNMTSGIPNELGVIYRRVTERQQEIMTENGYSDRDFRIFRDKACAPVKCSFWDFLEIVNDEPLEFVPGTAYSYSDTNYMMMGEIIGRISGMSIGEFMTRRIFEPLGMTRTRFGAEFSDGPSYDFFDEIRENLGKAHFVTAEGAISTTAEDLCKWLNAVLRGELISKKSWAECFTMYLGYGFGWHRDGMWLGHGGGDLGYSSRVFINFGTQTAIAAALNEPCEGFFDALRENS